MFVPVKARPNPLRMKYGGFCNAMMAIAAQYSSSSIIPSQNCEDAVFDGRYSGCTTPETDCEIDFASKYQCKNGDDRPVCIQGHTCSMPRCSNLHVVPCVPSGEGTCHQRIPVSRRPPIFLVNQNSTTIRTVSTTKLTMKLVVNQVQKK
jgi:hypothetical protein